MKVFPICFASHDQFRAWENAQKHSQGIRSSYCEDCTPDYQGRMKAEGRCTHPDVTFVADDHGFQVGVRPESAKKRRGFRLDDLITQAPSGM